MARIPSPSLLLLPLLLLVLVSWAPPAAEGALIQPHNRPQWLMGAEDVAFEEHAPFEVRVRRSPQSSGSGDADQPGETNVFTRIWNRVKEFAKKAAQAFGQILEAFGCSKQNGASGGSGGGTSDAEVMSPDKLTKEE